MTRDELYINNTKADLNKTDITLSYKSNLLTDISKIVSNSSYTTVSYTHLTLPTILLV